MKAAPCCRSCTTLHRVRVLPSTRRENSEADFANGIGKLAAAVSAGGAGAKVIADDIGYFDEPFFQDGIVAQAIDAVEANGVAYFSAAGNDGTLAYDNTAPSFATLSTRRTEFG